MAWLSSVSWTTSDAPVLATVLNNIGADLRTWGANVDAGGYELTNLGGLRGASSVLALKPDGTERARVTATGFGIGVDPSFPLHVVAGSSALYFHRNTDQPYLQIGDGTRSAFFHVNPSDGCVVGSISNHAFAIRTNNTNRITVSNGGVVKIASLPNYANNAAAISGGLAAGSLYRTAGDPDLVCIVH